jgi:predicted transcriptional regulator
MAEPEMDQTRPNRDVFDLGPIGKMVGSQRLSVFEILTVARRRGLTIPQIVTSSGVPTATVHRIMKEFLDKGLVTIVDKDGKAPVYALNPSNKAAVETARSLMEHARRIAAMKAGEAMHGGMVQQPEQGMMTLHLLPRKDLERNRPRLSYNADVRA